MQESFFNRTSKFALACVCLAMWKCSVWRYMWHCMCLRWAVPWAVEGSAAVGEGERSRETRLNTHTLTGISSPLQKQRCSWERIAGECTAHTHGICMNAVSRRIVPLDVWNGNLSLDFGWALCEPSTLTLCASVSEHIRGEVGRCILRYTWARQTSSKCFLSAVLKSEIPLSSAGTG